MLKVCYEAWGESPEFLRDVALHHDHPRTRERFLALYEITCGRSASEVSRQTQRHPQTVMEWVHRYNEKGHESLFYRRTGGSRPLFAQPSAKA